MSIFLASLLTIYLIPETIDYENLYNDMKNSPTELKIKFEGFGEDREYLNLKIKTVEYRKTLSADSSELYELTIILEQE